MCRPERGENKSIEIARDHRDRFFKQSTVIQHLLFSAKGNLSFSSTLQLFRCKKNACLYWHKQQIILRHLIEKSIHSYVI